MDILEHFRQSYIKYESTEILSCTHFCGNSEISCGNVSSIFDPEAVSFAYATKELSQNVKPYFLIEFLKFSISLKSIKISTLCGEPKTLIIEGSNDRITWYKLNNITTLKANAEETFDCEKSGSFRIIRFRQIGINGLNTYRFHIYKINLYGKLSRYFECTRRSPARNIPPLINSFLV